MTFYKIKDIEPPATYLSKIIKEHLSKNEKVVWLPTGGSAIKVAITVSKNLAGVDLSNLLVILTDERYVPTGDKDSNWQQLIDAGFSLPGAQLFSVLENKNIEQTTDNYNDLLERIIDSADYKIGLFGMGPDGHTAALFPNFPELNEDRRLVTHLNNSPKPPARRMTMTVAAIKKLDEAILFAMGQEKRLFLEKLQNDGPYQEQPLQALKLTSKLTIFNDQIGEEL
jgi:6-phosphogluconolactonase